MKVIRLLPIATLVLLLLTSCNRSDAPASTSASSNGNPSNTAGSPGGSAGATTGTGTDKPVAVERPIVLAPGTHITVSLGETLSSNHSQAGQEFTATVAKPVTVEGRTLIEQGAAARGTVVDAKAMGHFKGGAMLHVRLVSVTINGKERQIETTATGAQLKGKGKRSAIAIGGGAGAGAILGGIFGGGKGAAIGAAAGGGAGTAGAAFTGNKEIVFPAETAMTFRLKQAVEVK